MLLKLIWKESFIYINLCIQQNISYTKFEPSYMEDVSSLCVTYYLLCEYVGVYNCINAQCTEWKKLN
jgi:hypothetical protein